MFTQQRILGVDIAKTLAIIFVIAGHFFTLHTSFLSTPFVGFSMFLQGVGFELFLAGVPLFLLATGYLNCQKTINRHYFIKIFKVLTSYLFFSVIVLLFRRYYCDEEISILEGLKMILGFNAIPYAWYIEMWIGLYLLTPFLNILYKGLLSRKNKHILLLVLYILTAVPYCTNRYGLHLLPDFWIVLWPLLFFFLGTYMREYPIELSNVKIISIVLGICLIEPIFNLVVAPSHDYIQPIGDKLFMPILSCMIFSLCMRQDISNKHISKLFQKVSSLSLDIYLCCYIFDVIVYEYCKSHFPLPQSQFGLLIFIVCPLVFIFSMAMAQIKDYFVCSLMSLWTSKKCDSNNI